MFKFLTSLFMITSVSVTVFAKDDTYVFEAKGAFAKELKALIEKYSKEGKIEAKVYKKSPRSKSIIGSILGGGDNMYTKSGKELYMKDCASCHGAKGEAYAGAGSRPLKNMSEDEIISALEAYRRDDHYGGSMKMLMQQVAVPLRTTDIEEIAAYIKGKPTANGNVDSEITDDNTEEESSYLK